MTSDKFLLFLLAILIAGCSSTAKVSIPQLPPEVSSSTSNSHIDMTPGVTYIINPEKSFVMWKGSTVIGMSHSGKIKLIKGKFGVPQKSPSFKSEVLHQPFSGEALIDMSSLISDEELNKLEEHLKSKDFFNVEQFPFGRFKITNMYSDDVRSEPAQHYQVVGELTLKGITHSVTIPMSIKHKDNEIEAKGSFTIDRTKWEIGGAGLGDQALKKDIDLSLFIIVEKNNK